MSSYNEDFYKLIRQYSYSSAQEVVPLVLDLVKPKNVIDVGCGIGTWLSVYKEYGVEEIFGVDGNWVEPNLLEIPSECFLSVNLEDPLPVDRKFDLVMSLEVAEHLVGDRAETFVDSLVKLGPVCLFSAAIPAQGGVNHVNEQWPEYWIHLFQNRGYVTIDCIRKRVWELNQVTWWYSQNIFLFVQQAYLPYYPLLQSEFQNNTLRFSVVHPALYQHKSQQHNVPLLNESVHTPTSIRPYSKTFYQSVKASCQSSAEEIVPVVMKLMQPKSVIEIGCGVGTWLSVFQQHGVQDIFGMDGNWVDTEDIEIDLNEFLTVDLEKPLPLPINQQQFDLVVALTLAERIPHDCADTFVDSIVRLGKVCLFSSAIPYQSGLNHINEQWPQYWVQRFQERGYQVIDCIRPKIWNNPKVAWWYAQNILLFASSEVVNQSQFLKYEQQKTNTSMLSIIHPTLYLSRC
ncbi:class I SAM-dependent methyltransferase [Planktothrix agardhii 1029]|uniref:class I SAM-dependent methyltransferase n=1 Tax=Planktothrix agardhii TaxID=1160 RepID=UPI001D0BD681|nr:methyltransferase domain-containing protein [Planktothrix agardhii]MCB8777748.1 class I SAM-dependent methyltransferase [Planktothrix agardhii 1031]MCF3578849.1 class I SAM-dependent methyltransferase [Planktothrix agardhii 1812]MCF3589981.1 class I SAM-dependent methyltransferase [Planktothrix agardhii 1029]MCF3598740.1 class I SAM-dependent methyltransferase [Planktothrix agardhii 1032]MCF3620555.1 class I SAM-dependent methyltransferase [Planktothrix agardhii 1030]